MASHPLPGLRWFLWVRNRAVRIGALTGVYLSAVLVTWLVIANRLPVLYPFAGIRNFAAAVAVLLLMLVPILRFLKSPARLFLSGLVAWSLLTLTYVGACQYFSRLESRLGSFHLFMLGTVIYGFVAVACWVVSLIWAARHQPLSVSRRHPF